MKQRIKEIIKELNESVGEIEWAGGFSPNSNIIFDKAISIYLTEIIQGNKNNQENNQPKPISEAQANYLSINRKDLIARGFNLDAIQYSKDAFKVIKQHKELIGEK